MGAEFWNAFMASGFTAAFGVAIWGIRVLVRLDTRVAVIEEVLKLQAPTRERRARRGI